ncbi:MAG: DNA methyltransferase [bacterium]|nr:DNA methyltransferase [bacterium]
MQKYIFILGRNPELSQKELFSYLEARKISYTMEDCSDIACVLEIKNISPEKCIKDLGGIQKIALVIDSLDSLYMGTKNKVRYAISQYGEETKEEDYLRLQLKAYFKKEKIKATIKKSHREQQEYLNPSEAQNLIEIIQYKNYLAKTLAVFNPRDYKFRDTKRPAQRPLHTVSIRLAKILINLSGAKPRDTVLDPFCGIGTIIQEAMLMGMEVIGIDKEKFCIEASKQNLDWIRKEYNCAESYRLIHSDARQVAKYLTSVDCVATEPYLGPFLKKYPTEKEARRIVQELFPLYQEVLYNLIKITKKRIVFITPRFRTTAKKDMPINLAPLLEKKGLSFEGPFLYSSPTSRILREIWVIKK